MINVYPLRFNLVARQLVTLLLITGMTACGGGGGGSDNDSGRLPLLDSDLAWNPGEFEPSAKFKDRCEAPRSGIAPYNGKAYPDRAGSTLTENHWLRSWSNETYLWYDEIIDRSPADYDDPLGYFSLLRTFERTPAGTFKDQFHFAEDTAAWQAQSGSGVSVGYGLTWALIGGFPPREIRVAYTEPNSPATAPGIELARGALVLEVNGVDAVYDNSQEGVDMLNRALFPAEPGQSATLVVRDIGSTTTRTVTLTATTVTSTPVQQVRLLEAASGEQIGYMLFNDHIATAESLLRDAVDHLSSAGATQLVLDLRYNGGGLLAIGSQLAYMIAGDTQTAGRTFYQTRFNDKHPTHNPVTGQPLSPIPFLDYTLGFSTAAGQPLPSLNLKRVYILTGSNTCSASEAIINGLRGVNVEVVQIGAATCGKPYGFYPEDNCGTTYFTVQFTGANAKGFGEYPDGFRPGNDPADPARVPGCLVADDYLHQLGDPEEARLAAALVYHETGSCPTAVRVGMQKQGRPVADGEIFKPESLRNTLLLPTNEERRP